MTTADTIGRESSRPMRTSTRYWYLAPPLFLQCFPILYRETPMFKPRFMPILLAATHHMKSASPKLCCWSISKEKNFSWKDICLSCLQPVWANIQTVFAIAGSGAELQLKNLVVQTSMHLIQIQYWWKTKISVNLFHGGTCAPPCPTWDQQLQVQVMHRCTMHGCPI